MFRFLNPRMFLAWTLSIVASYFMLGFLGNLYLSFPAIVIITFLVQSLFGILLYRLLGKGKALYLSQSTSFWLALSIFIVLTVFVGGMFELLTYFPRSFDTQTVLLENGQLLPFGVGAVLTIPALAWGRMTVKQGEIKQNRSYKFLDEILTGALLAGFFFAVYFMLASVFNRTVFDVDDIFFDSDGLLWRTRFTTDVYRDYYWRAVHPFVLIIIRPLGAFISLFLKGDRLLSSFILVALAGALCVFFTWYFVKHITGNSIYAVLIASLLGGSAAHLVFGSLLETYIFLAVVMLGFLVLLLKDVPLFAYIIVGLASFGITVTNFIQTAIAFIFAKRNIKSWIYFGLTVAALTIPLTLLNNFVYPNSQPYFFVPSSYTAEAENTFAPSISRGVAIVRVMFFHSIVAPDPLLLQEEIPFLKVWIFKADPMRVSEYKNNFGNALAFAWLGLLVLGGILFLKNFKRDDKRFTPAFILILLFNFALHLRYGKDLFLYSTNWTYAIILFLALAWKELADKRWFQIILLIFITLLLANNSRLILTMLSASALHIK